MDRGGYSGRNPAQTEGEAADVTLTHYRISGGNAGQSQPGGDLHCPVRRPTGVSGDVYLLRGDHILVNMDNSRKRLQHIKNDPRVSLTVLDDGDWYTHVTVIGRVNQMYDDEGLADIDALSRRYTDQDYPRRDRPRTSALIEVDRVHGWGSQKNNDQPTSRQ